MKIKMYLAISFIVFCAVSTPNFAGGRGYGFSSRTFSSVHSVRSYYRMNGSYVPSHLAGNPGSGVHCRNNVCY